MENHTPVVRRAATVYKKRARHTVEEDSRTGTRPVPQTPDPAEDENSRRVGNLHSDSSVSTVKGSSPAKEEPKQEVCEAPIAPASKRRAVPSVKSKASTPQRQPKKYQQLCLDFGQKSIGPRQCPECGMSYNAVQKDDDALHRRFHKAVVNGIEWPVGCSRRFQLLREFNVIWGHRLLQMRRSSVLLSILLEAVARSS